ncbi:MAG: class I adenylate-forming enzyme family protein [Acidobacteriota bacterium]
MRDDMRELFLDAIEGVQDLDRIAVSDAEESVTYGALLDGARRTAGALASRHPSPGNLIVKAPSSVGFVRTLLGIMYSGCTPVPVDPDLPARGLDFIRAKCGAATALEPLGCAALADAAPVDRRNPDVPALVMFTSGTSGFPKGVLISNANLLASCRAMAGYLGYAQHASAAVVLPLHYSYALLSQVCCQLTVGGRVHLFSDLRNPLRVARIVGELGLETFCGVPSTFHTLTIASRLSPIQMPSVRVLCSAGAAMDPALLPHVKRVFPNAVFFNNYGMTEAAPRIAFCREDDPRFHEATCGRPMAGVEVKIVDPETHREVPDGVRGVLVVRGPNVTSGYLNEPELTARAFTHDGYLVSGDVAYRDRDYLFICGRVDDMFNSGGEKIAPLEVEQVLNRMEGVEMSALAGVPDEQRGMVAVAYLKLADRAITRAGLVQHLSQELPKSRIPSRFMEVRSFPMTTNGKLQRRRLSPEDRELVIREIR